MERHDELEVNDEAVPSGFVLRVLVGAIVITVGLCFLTYMILRARETALRPVIEDRNLGAPREHARVRAEPYEIQHPLAPIAERQRQMLGQWGWADRDQRVVRVPIDRAIDLWLAKEGAK